MQRASDGGGKPASVKHGKKVSMDKKAEGGAEDDASNADEPDPLMSHISALIPPLLSSDTFAQEVLGFEDYSAAQQTRNN